MWGRHDLGTHIKEKSGYYEITAMSGKMEERETSSLVRICDMEIRLRPTS